MTIDAFPAELASLVHVSSGYPFRGSIAEVPDGDTLVVQMKDVAIGDGVSWDSVNRTSLVGRKAPDRLTAGDVLFAAKGARFYAVCIDEPPDDAVCSPHFYRLRVKPHQPLLPAFVAWQINQPPLQRKLQQAAEGSGQLSIRRPVLEALTLSVPSLAAQNSIVAMAAIAHRERRIFDQLARDRERQLWALAESLAQPAQASH